MQYISIFESEFQYFAFITTLADRVVFLFFIFFCMQNAIKGTTVLCTAFVSLQEENLMHLALRMALSVFGRQ